MGKNQNFIPQKNKQPDYIPPEVQRDLINKTVQLACNLVGFPCAVTIFKHNERPYYRLEADLEVVEKNVIVWSYLKEFNLWYLAAHQVHGKPGRQIAFSDFITCLHDFSLHWTAFSALDPVRSSDISNLCRKINAEIGKDIAQAMQQKQN